MNSINTNHEPSPFYRALWRWHFFAALFVAPFLLSLSLSGILMLLSEPLDTLLHNKQLQVLPQGERLTAAAQLKKVRERYPASTVKLYIPPQSENASSQFSLVSLHHHSAHGGHGVPTNTLYVNPYTGKILGEQDPAATLYAKIKAFHGTLLLGDWGDALIEIAAGLAVLMVLSGLYLAWPRAGWRDFLPRGPIENRNYWRSLHKCFGLLIALPLLFFLVSGLAWTNVWGGKLTQAWSSVPDTSFKATNSSLDQAGTHKALRHNALKHKALAREGMQEIPWALEQTALPASNPVDSSDVIAGMINLDSVIAFAEQQGLANYRVHIPQGNSGVWTISATTMAGDIKNPWAERVVHLDQYSGEVLAELRFADYPAMGKAMAAAIPFHQGDLGIWNLLLNLGLCTLIFLLVISGINLWWKRRPPKGFRLAPPMASAEKQKVAIILMSVAALAFPLSAAAIVAIILLDWLLISRLMPLKKLFK